MHGRKRTTREEHDSDEVKTARAEKYNQYLIGCKHALSSDEAAGKAEKLLRYNPDFLTLFNSRRRYILKLLKDNTEQDPITIRKENLDKEFELTKQQISERNSKSYGAWFHRRWAIEILGIYEGQIIFSIPDEIALCDMLLTRDERNFHCWAHRNFVASLGGVSNKELLEKSSSLIEKNFSNYSAWHLRVQVLRYISNNPAENADFDWGEEFEIVHHAIFTEPADQSAWLYFRWLLPKFMTDFTRIAEEIETIKSLLEEEGDCKWPLLALLQLYSMFSINETNLSLVTDICNRLEKVDSSHNIFYQHILSLFQAHEIEKLRKVLFCSNRT